MSKGSAIEWTESTWNPITGCSKISPGCKHCYAERMAKRLKAMGVPQYADGFAVTLQEKTLEAPLGWSKPQVIFVNSMSDLFHADVPDDFIMQVFDVMARADWHTFQVLTKRPERAAELSKGLSWAANIWMGTSVENQRFTSRIVQLRRTDARVKFLSCEPLLGPLRLKLDGVDWVIVGGESGPRSRPMRADWAREIRTQCEAAGVAFFFKQWGAHNELGVRVGKGRAGRVLDGRTWDAMPERRALSR
jgi:protein gp37